MQGAERLLTLQEIDSAVDRLVVRRRALESDEPIAAARAEADTAERALGELGLQLDTIRRDQQRFEHEIDSISQKIGAEEVRLFDGSVANAKELESIRHEVESLKKRRSDREDELIVVLEQREELEGRAKEAEIGASALRGNLDEVGAAAMEELRTVMSELDVRADARAGLTPLIDPELLGLYEDLRRTKKGVGAVALVDGVCQGCHEQLSAVALDRLKRTDGIKRCDHCRRILVA